MQRNSFHPVPPISEILNNSSFIKKTLGTTLNHIDTMKGPHFIDIDLTAEASDEEIPEFQNLLGSAFSGTLMAQVLYQISNIRIFHPRTSRCQPE
jgi:hypothetical protein